MKHMKMVLIAGAVLLTSIAGSAAQTRTPNEDVKFPTVAKDQSRPARATKAPQRGSVTSKMVQYPTPIESCDITATSCFSPNLCTSKSFGTKLKDKFCGKDQNDLQDCYERAGSFCDRYQKGSGLYECKTCAN